MNIQAPAKQPNPFDLDQQATEDFDPAAWLARAAAIGMKVSVNLMPDGQGGVFSSVGSTLDTEEEYDLCCDLDGNHRLLALAIVLSYLAAHGLPYSFSDQAD